MPQLGKFAGNIFAAEDAVAAQPFVDAGHRLAGAVEIDDEFLEEALGELDGDALDPPERLGGVMGLLHDEFAHLLQALGPQQREIDGVRDGPEID